MTSATFSYVFRVTPVPFGTREILPPCLPLHRCASVTTSYCDIAIIFPSLLEVNKGLICRCTLAFKAFFKHFASRSFFKNTSPGLTPRPKTNVPLRGRSDSGPLVRQNTGGRGFVILGNETEVTCPRAGATEVQSEEPEDGQAPGGFLHTRTALLLVDQCERWASSPVF